MWQGYYESYPWEVHCALVGTVKLVKEEISKIPTADVAPVVRCKDCVYAELFDGSDEFLYCMNRDGLCTYVADDDYCSYGERGKR